MMKELGAADYQQNVSAALAMGAMFRAIHDCPVPVVGRIQGPAYGGGVGLVASCDVVVAAPQVSFVFSEVRLGMVPGVIAPLVIERMGPAAARRCFLTAEMLPAAEAQRLGLVDHVAEDGKLDDAVAGFTDLLLQGGPNALGLCKGLVQGVASLGYTRSAELAARMISEARGSEEAQAALTAFAEKKSAPWVDPEG
jgi:methylglutaconyl-CoA hydratase